MSYTYDATKSKKDMGSMVSLSICHLIFSIINMFSSTFLVAHIYSLTDNVFDYIKNVGIFQLSTFIVMLISYFIFSYIVDKTNRVWVYRLSSVILSVVVVITIFYGQDIAKIIVLAGILMGLTYGSYYASYNVLKQEMVSRKSMKTFAVTISALSKIVSIVFPVLLGTLIEISTFSMVAIYVFILNVALIIVSFFIKAKKPQGSSFKMIDYIKNLKNNNSVNCKIKAIYKIAMFYGFVNVISSVFQIYIMMQFGSSFSLGLFSSISSVLSIVLLLIINKYSKIGKRGLLFIIPNLLFVSLTFIYTFIPNIVTLLCVYFSLTVCDCVLAIVFDIERNKNLKEAGLYHDIAEHQFVIEAIFQIIRIICFTLLIFIGVFNSFVAFKIFFIVIVLMYSVSAYLMMKFEKTNYDKTVDK
jgi:YQGE family putative transporter